MITSIRRSILIGLAGPALLLLAAVAMAQEGVPPQDAVRKVIAEYDEADKAGDIGAKMRLYLSDAVLLPPEGPPVVGASAIRGWQEAQYQRASVQNTSTVDEVQVFGQWAFARGTWTGTVTPRTGGAPTRTSGKFLTVLRRLPDGGAWRIARDMWNAEPGAASAASAR
jgi:uncharacterized protein (TIGR02246 family)